MFTFADTGDGLHFIPAFIVSMFKGMCYEIKKKCNDTVKSTLNSFH